MNTKCAVLSLTKLLEVRLHPLFLLMIVNDIVLQENMHACNVIVPNSTTVHIMVNVLLEYIDLQ